jgi:two-component system sensor histidine kinase TctE
MTLPTLRRRMLWRVILPLALTWLAGSIVALTVASVYTRRAFDRSLLDDARAIGANVTLLNDELAFSLTPREVGAVLFDQEEKVFFAVLRQDGSLLTGQGGLREEPLTAEDEGYVFADRHYRGLDLRMVTLTRLQPRLHAVVVAQTTRSRAQLTGQIFIASLLPQALLLALLGLWLRGSIGRELAPLARLERELDERDTRDLTPVNLAPRSRDIEHLAQAFNGLMARIAAGVRAQREFAGNVAHELRTPLAGIRSLAEFGLAQSDPAAWQAQLRRIVASEQRASHLVDQMLALALADEARQSLQLEPVAVHELVQSLLLRLLPKADAQGVDLGAEGLEGPPVHVWGSPALVEGLLGNLADNALRYGRPTGSDQAPQVTVGVHEVDGQVRLCVTDNGPGMDAELRQRVLARWEQGPSGLRERGGVGLGLAIVERYVALMGGRLALEPGPGGQGLRACVWLRRAEPPPAL